ncbi:unnamed protein product [Symbiodinium natans]|uniref:Uncharacterized protein n=1 Tax=Symbiodinium natans TaxID=878477 RepID=A0A812RQR4_9DINO|nr:unnamed protein product [Symbiodinium natans]
MGQTCCADEPGDTPGTLTVSVPASTAPPGTLMSSLRGHWTRKEDRMALGTISANSMDWESPYQHQPSTMWEAGPETVKMILAGKEYSGTVSLSENPITILWEDGEVWTKTPS